VFLLLSAPEVAVRNDCSAAHVAGIYMQFIRRFPCEHRAAFLGYARQKGFDCAATDGGVECVSAGGERLSARFVDRLVSLDFTALPGGGKPAGAAPEGELPWRRPGR
jgi:hypothetical protein